MSNQNNRCGIFIDIEGTKSIYQNDELKFYRSLDSLLSSALKISCIQFPETNRLLVHQMGADGVFIISDFLYKNLEIPISISIYLMQRLLIIGSVGKCGISIGDFADIQSCLPLLKNQIELNQLNPNCGGLMSKVNVMGTALIKSYRLTGKPSGSLVSITKSLESTIPEEINYREIETKLILDWIHTETEPLNFIYKALDEEKYSIDDLEKKLISYVDKTPKGLCDKWIVNTISFNGCKIDE